MTRMAWLIVLDVNRSIDLVTEGQIREPTQICLQKLGLALCQSIEKDAVTNKRVLGVC